MEILKFQDRICYLDFSVFNSSNLIRNRYTKIKLPFNFIDSIPKEVTDFYTDYNSKELLDSDFYFSIAIVRPGLYYRKKSGNIIHYLKNHLEYISINLYPDAEEYYKKYPNEKVIMLLNKEEYMPSEDCKELLLEFYNSISLPNDVDYYRMINNIINKL
jgi:hypothetical protein